MSTWMVITGVWAMCAICAVLFIRGAHPHFARPGDETHDGPRGSADGVSVPHGVRVASADRRNE